MLELMFALMCRANDNQATVSMPFKLLFTSTVVIFSIQVCIVFC